MAARPHPDYLISPVPGYSPTIGRLVSMLAYVRATTLEAVEGLTQRELDHLLDEQSNSIAMLLEHIPSVEEYYQRNSLGLTTQAATSERTRLGANLGEEARERVRGQPLAYYLERMHAVRTRTLEALAQRDDAWLDEVHPFGNAKLANNHFKWFHVLEDELSHGGQILLIRKRLPPRATDHP